MKPHWLFSISEPLNLTVTDVNEHDLTVSWEKPVVDFTRFEVRCEADGDYSDYSGDVEKSDDELSVYTFTCKNLTSGANYTVKVETFNEAAAVSEPSTVNSTTSEILRKHVLTSGLCNFGAKIELMIHIVWHFCSSFTTNLSDVITNFSELIKDTKSKISISIVFFIPT